MFNSIRGLVLGFSLTWRTTEKAKYKKILIGFPNEKIEPLWCTIFGEENWGYEKDRLTGRKKPIQLKSGLMLSLTGRFETRPKIKIPELKGRSFIVQSDGSYQGGFTVLNEVRQKKVITVPGSVLKGSWRSLTFFDISIKNKRSQLFRGTIKYSSDKPVESWKGLVIEGNPLVTGLDKNGKPNEFFYDNNSDGKVLAYGKSPSTSEAWSSTSGASD